MGLKITTATGPVLQNTSANDTWTADALAAADSSNYILYFGGLDTSAAAETTDRLNIDWPTAQVDLIQKPAGLDKPLVVIASGDILDSSPVLSLSGVDSLIWANWPGQDGGPAYEGNYWCCCSRWSSPYHRISWQLHGKLYAGHAFASDR